jgi:hypothetical protein
LHDSLRRMVVIAIVLFLTCATLHAADELPVDGDKSGTLQAVIAKLPPRIERDMTIRVTGSIAPAGEGATLELSRPMREGVRVRIVGDGGTSILNWTAGDEPLVSVTQGRWSLQNVQIGSRQKGQRRGVRVIGPAVVELHDVRIRTASQSAPGLHATRGGLAELFGKIELNEDLHDKAEGETFAGVEADYGGVVRFRQREKASLSIGNGSLSASHYGIIELGCAEARVTSWHEQANAIAVNNSGRVDFHSTKATLAARNPRNTTIGLEHDGHVLAEGAAITLRGFDNGNAIVLQKASTLFCNDVTFAGSFRTPLSAMSGSTLLIGVNGELAGGEVLTGARIILEKCTGKLAPPISAGSQGILIDAR